MVNLSPDISFKLQIDHSDKRLQNGLFSEAVSCPKPDNIDSDKSPRIAKIYSIVVPAQVDDGAA